MKKSFLVVVVMLLVSIVAYADPSIQEIRVNQDPDVYCTPQHEPSIAIDPTDTNRILVVAHQPTTFGGLQSLGVYYSPDSGSSWEQVVLNAEDFDPKRPELNWAVDPSTAVDQNGNFYIGIMGNLGTTEGHEIGIIKSGVYIARLLKRPKGEPMFHSVVTLPTSDPTAKGVKFTAVSVQDGLLANDDKMLIAVDHYKESAFRGRVYVAWTHFERPSEKVEFKTRILFTYSVDDAKTFAQPISLDVGNDNRWPHAPFLTVGPAGELFAFWFAFDEKPQNDQTTPFQGSIHMAKSIDGGKTFSKPHLIRKFVSPPRRLAPTLIKVNGYPQAAVSPKDGKIVAFVWSEYGTGDADAFIAFSTDGGLLWSEPQRLNDDPLRNGRDQFFPTVSIDESGTVWAAWIDRRVDDNLAYYDLFAAYGDLNGKELRLSANLRVTSASSVLGHFCHSNRLIGDYNWSAVSGQTFIPVWADGRRGQLDIFIAKITKSSFPRP